MAGASIFAVVATPPLATAELEALATPIAEAGADKLLLCEATDFGNPPFDAIHGRALDAAVARVPPMFVLFPAGGSGAALGAPLAARLGGPFAPWCDFLTSDADVPVPDSAGRVQLVYLRPDGRSRRRLDPLDIERPIVATLGAGRRSARSGSLRNLEIEIVASIDSAAPPPPPHHPTMAPDQERVRDPHATIELAAVVVLIADAADFASDDTSDDRVDKRGPGELLLEALSDQHRPDTMVVRASDVPASVLGACCPDVVLKIGPCPGSTARSPRTRVVLVAPPGSSDLTSEDVDIVWQLQSPEDLTPASLGELLAEIGGTV